MSPHKIELVELAAIAAGRDHITTPELARAANCKPQTIRKQHCLVGSFHGIRPMKLGRRLLWPVAQVVALLAPHHSGMQT